MSTSFKNAADFADWCQYHRRSVLMHDELGPVYLYERAGWNGGKGSVVVRPIGMDGDMGGEISTTASLLRVGESRCRYVNTLRGGVVKITRHDRRQWRKGWTDDNIVITENVRGVATVLEKFDRLPTRGEWYTLMARAIAVPPMRYDEAVAKLLSDNTFACAMGDNSFLVYSPTRADDLEIVVEDRVVAVAPLAAPGKVTVRAVEFKEYLQRWGVIA